MNNEAGKNNILLVANWESNVGYAWWLMENFWIRISEHFSPQGKQCYLLYPGITEIPEAIAASNITVHEHNFRDRSPASRRRLQRFIQEHGIRYIYLTDSPSYSLFYPALRRWGIRKIVVHDHTPGDRTPASGWKRMIKSAVQRIPGLTADHFIAVTDFVCRRLVEVTCIPENKCSVARNGIHPIELEGKDPAYAARVFGIPEDRIIVVTTGRAANYKGIDFFIECADELVNRRRLNRFHFLFCGDGPNLDRFRELVKHYRLQAFFTFAGKRNDIREILPSCDIGFHTSKGEVGYSLSILEYMSAGLAALVPDRPSTSECIEDGTNGRLYKAGDIQSACDILVQLQDRDTRKQLSDRAVPLVRENYDIQQTNRQLIDCLQEVFV